MKTSGKNIVPVDVISRVLSGEAIPDEKRLLDSWIESSEDNRALFGQYRKLWEKTGEVSPSTPPDIDYEWHTFRERAGMLSDTHRPVRRIGLTRILAAAVMTGIILGSAAFLSYHAISYKTVKSGSDIASIELPDNSLVTLNRGSKLKYPRRFHKDSRMVTLTGEAFFNVHRNTAAPFAVKSKDIFVEVLGTSFNVNALKESPTIQVTVEQGKVAVYQKALKENAEILLAGEKAIYNNSSGSILKVLNEDTNYNAWKTGLIIFDDESLVKVTELLSKVYGKKVKADESISSEKITVRFDNEDLSYILKTIETTLDIKADEVNGTFVLSR